MRLKYFGVIGIITIIAMISIILISGRVGKKIISEEEAIKKALIHQYGSEDRYISDYGPIQGQRDKVLDVSKDIFWNYIIHLCDLNIECPCRENEGYWIKISKDGSSVSTKKQNLCLFG